MLKYLHIENIAVIERSDIEFKEGLNVLTGETGAGKSIVIDSINAVLGERTSKDLIRTGCDRAEVSALFGEISSENLKKIAEFDIAPDEDGNILISRTLSLNGKGIIKINGKPFTASTLREIAEFLIDIHGQHDNQSLLNPDKHCGFIDAIANNTKELQNYYNEFKSLNAIRKELQSLEMDEAEKQHKTELLTYQIKELEEADIKIGEIEDLKEKLKLAENFEQTQKALSISDGLFHGDDDTDGAILLLKNIAKQLSVIDNKEIEKLLEKLNNIISNTEDIADIVSSKLNDNGSDELNADNINQRLDLLYRLMLKYGNSEEKMLDFLSGAKAELESITFSDKRSSELSDELEASKERLIKLGNTLTKTRVLASQKFKKDVLSVLEYLNMKGVNFFADINQGRYTKNGCDTVEFIISANSGETAK
ncbi:MAG: AAA family ATPase, partial [Clostridia bacterium]|nr:AAA family ATPase [Clostridia bacterium]